MNWQDRNPWLALIIFCVTVWIGVIIALYMAAGCSVDAPC